MARALKVFRTSAGFHDAYVAAPSRKAALAAWGADVDLFARGIAEQVTDPEFTAAPLKKPGEVVMISRGGLADQLKAMGPRKARAKGGAKEGPAKRGKADTKPPSRAALDRAEAALAAMEAKHSREIAALETERDAIERKIDAANARQEKALKAGERRVRDLANAYRDKLAEWSG